MSELDFVPRQRHRKCRASGPLTRHNLPGVSFQGCSRFASSHPWLPSEAADAASAPNLAEPWATNAAGRAGLIVLPGILADLFHEHLVVVSVRGFEIQGAADGDRLVFARAAAVAVRLRPEVDRGV